MAERRRRPRQTPDFDRVIDVTIDLLQAHGEIGFRIEDLMERTGISKSSLYNKFGDREGLIGAAHARQYHRLVEESVVAIRYIVDTAKSTEELERMLATITRMTQNPGRDWERMARISAIAGTAANPEFRARLEEAQTSINDALADMIEIVDARGLARPKYPPRTIAAFVQAYTLGRVLAGFDTRRTPDEVDQWNRLIDDVVHMMFFDGPGREGSKNPTES